MKLEPEVTYNVPPGTDYGDVDAVNPSSLKVMLKSPKHYRHGLESVRRETKAMREGTLAHLAVLQPDLFRQSVVIRPDGLDGRTKDGKEWLAAHSHLTVITVPEWEQVQGMAQAVNNHPVAMRYMTPGAVEQPIYWIDPETGIRCKGRPDLVTDSGFLVDLKTAADLTPRKFIAQACDLGYLFSMAAYHDGLELLGHKASETVLVCVEKSAPYDVAVWQLDGEPLEMGREQYRAALRDLAECRASGEWPGRFPELRQFEVPGWAYPEVERAIDDDDFGMDEGEEA
jgi:hypothetical protein